MKIPILHCRYNKMANVKSHLHGTYKEPLRKIVDPMKNTVPKSDDIDQRICLYSGGGNEWNLPASGWNRTEDNKLYWKDGIKLDDWYGWGPSWLHNLVCTIELAEIQSSSWEMGISWWEHFDLSRASLKKNTQRYTAINILHSHISSLQH